MRRSLIYWEELLQRSNDLTRYSTYQEPQIFVNNNPSNKTTRTSASFVENPPSYRAARWVTEIGAPAVLVTALLLMSSVSSVSGLDGLLYGLVAVLFVTGIPFLCVVLLTRRGRLSDHHISVRTQRAPVLAGACLSLLVGIIVLQLLGAPLRLTVMIFSVLAGIFAVLAVNLVWKLSAHAAVASFFMVAMVVLLGGAGLLSAVVPLAVGWSRVRLGAHTTAQVLAGTVVGLLIGAGFALVLV